LTPEERVDILRTQAGITGRTAQILEKDFWICWTLEALFSMPEALPMAFKGGTSLSKVFGAIHRFSEDIDITVDFRFLDSSVDPFAPTTSRKQQERLTEHLQERVAAYVAEVVTPNLRECLHKELQCPPGTIEFAGEDLWIHYPSELGDRSEYVTDVVKLEFGGRNSIEPSDRRTVEPYLLPLPGVELPSASVTVLAAERTFWEKATLIHAELSRGSFRSSTERLSRHWYDLHRLAAGPIGLSALADVGLLHDVVKFKKVFYRSAQSGYDRCVTGGLQLVPTDDVVAEALQRDYEKMVSAKMFYDTPPRFDEILEDLRRLANHINEKTIDFSK
jgi:predicted nucleotidyltransferase component of viral defense system